MNEKNSCLYKISSNILKHDHLKKRKENFVRFLFKNKTNKFDFLNF